MPKDEIKLFKLIQAGKIAEAKMEIKKQRLEQKQRHIRTRKLLKSLDAR